MSLFGLLKSNSRHALRDYRGRACLILLIHLGVRLLWTLFLIASAVGLSGGLSLPGISIGQFNLPWEQFYIVLGIQIVTVLFTVFLFTPLSLGTFGWYIGVVKAQAQPLGAIFAFFERLGRYFRALWYSVNMIVRTMFWAIVFFLLPMGVLAGALVFSDMYGDGAGRQFAILSAFGIILAILLILLALLLYCAYMTKYFLAAYLLASDDNITVRAAIKQSIRLTSGYRFSLLWYGLSFIGWALLTLICLPLIFYTAPYIRTSFAMYAHYLIEKSRAGEALPVPQGELPKTTQEFSHAQIAIPPAADENLALQHTTRIDELEGTAKLEWEGEASATPSTPIEETPAGPEEPLPAPPESNSPTPPDTDPNNRQNQGPWPHM